METINIIGIAIGCGFLGYVILKAVYNLLKVKEDSPDEYIYMDNPKESMKATAYDTLKDLTNKKENTKEDKMEDNEEETYSYDFTCDNCNEELGLIIPVGTRVIDFVKKEKCETCGCLMLDEEASEFNSENTVDKE